MYGKLLLLVLIAAIRANAVTTVIRSIGTDTSALYTGTGNARIKGNGDTVVVNGSFPDNIGAGDSVYFDNGAGTAFVMAKFGADKLLLQSYENNISPGKTHKNVSVYRAFNSLQV